MGHLGCFWQAVPRHFPSQAPLVLSRLLLRKRQNENINMVGLAPPSSFRCHVEAPALKAVCGIAFKLMA